MGSSPVSDEIRDKIAVLWAKGLSASIIGQQLGRSRNSIIGLAFRMKLPSRDTEVASPRYNWPTDTPGVRKKRPKPIPKPPVLAEDIISLGVSLISALNHQCRYPLWTDNGAPEWKVCGNSCEGVYCSGHHAAARVPRQVKAA